MSSSIHNVKSPNQESQETLLELIKRPVSKAGARSTRREVEKLDALAKLGIPDDVLSGLSQRKLVFLTEQAKRHTAADEASAISAVSRWPSRRR